MLSTPQSRKFGITAKLLAPFVGIFLLAFAALGALSFRSTNGNHALILAGVGVLALVSGAAVYASIARRIKRQIDALAEIVINTYNGNPGYRAQVVTGDELGLLAASFNEALDRNRSMFQAEQKLGRMQSSLAKLHKEVTGLAQGDLTVRAEVTSDSVGPIADSFNYISGQLQTIISRVHDVSASVSSTASQTRKATESLAHDSEQHAHQALGARLAVEEMTQSIQQVSDNAARSAEVAQQSLANAKQGVEAVQNTMRGLRRVREQVQEAVKRIKRLEASTEEISEIVQLIDEIADRTGILALNASIQAQAAGKAGRGFSVVAEEVEQLAVRSTEATRRIAGLVKTVQMGTSEAIAAMEESAREIVEGSGLVNRAGQALSEIEATSTRLAELNHSISQVATRQASGSQAVFKSIAELSEFTEHTAAGIKQSAASVNDLAALADQLKTSVAVFKLPYSNGNGGSGLHADHGAR